jgi:hypothetical protein
MERWEAAAETAVRRRLHRSLRRLRRLRRRRTAEGCCVWAARACVPPGWSPFRTGRPPSARSSVQRSTRGSHWWSADQHSACDDSTSSPSRTAHHGAQRPLGYSDAHHGALAHPVLSPSTGCSWPPELSSVGASVQPSGWPSGPRRPNLEPQCLAPKSPSGGRDGSTSHRATRRPSPWPRRCDKGQRSTRRPARWRSRQISRRRPRRPCRSDRQRARRRRGTGRAAGSASTRAKACVRKSRPARDREGVAAGCDRYSAVPAQPPVARWNGWARARSGCARNLTVRRRRSHPY